MADIKLIKPQAGERVSIQSAADARLDFAFSTADAVLEKSGNDLVFTFTDGSSIVLTDFYTAYTKESLPEFVVEGQTIAGSEFFAALGNDDLMPAAGPAATRAADGGRFREYDESALMDGIDRLDGLDLPWAQQAFQDDFLAAGPGFLGTEDPANLGPELVPPTPDVLQVVESGVQKGGNDAEGGVPSMSGKINVTDPEGDALTFYFIDANGNKVSSITTEYGTITIDNNGNYTYTLNNEGAANGLAADEIFNENFTVGFSDSNGNVSNSTVNVGVDIKGTNDQPSLEVTENVLNVTEDGGLTGSAAKGDAQGDDVDTGAELTYSFGDKEGNSLGNEVKDADGVFTIDPKSGEYTYTLTNDSADVQALGEGESISKTFTIRVQDEHGAWSTQEVTVIITGTNDAPTVVVDNATLDVTESGVKDGGNDTEIGVPSASGTVKGSDVDTNDTLTYGVKNGTTLENGSIELDSPYGKFVLDPATGKYTYTLDNGASNSLSLGETRDETFTITVSDGKGGTVEQNITVTVKGTNDQPSLEVTENVLNVTEDGLTGSVGGEALGDDVDTGAELTYSFGDKEGNSLGNEVKDADGVFTIDPKSGEYTYTLTNDSADVQALGEGESISKTFTIRVQDEHGAWSTQEVTVIITGTNDAPTVVVDNATLDVTESGVKDGGNDTEIGVPSASGTVKGSDVDTNDTLTYGVKDGTTLENGSIELDSPYGKFVLDPATGKYTYTLDNGASNSLSLGETRDETFTITVSDGKGGTVEQNITVTVKGTNDQPSLEVTENVLHVTEDGGLTGSAAKGDAQGDDVDNGAELTYSFGDKEGNSLGNEVKDADGVFTIDPKSGEYTYTLTNDSADVQALGEGESITKTFTIRVQDEHGAWSTQEVTVIINGTNDAPTVDVDTKTLNLKEAGVTQSGGTPDATEYGTAVVNGKVNADDLDTTDKGNLTFDVQATPKEGDHTNVISSGTENGVQTIVTDHGTLTLNTATGEYTYTLNQEAANSPTNRPTQDPTTVDKLSEGEKRTEHFTVTVSDGKGGTTTQEITVEIEGTNDRPLITLNPYGGTVKEDSAGENSVNGVFTVTDEDNDAGTDRTFTISGDKDAGTSGELTSTGHTDKDPNTADTSAVFVTDYGTLTVNPDGTYSYVLNNESPDVQGLGEGQTHQETFWIKVTDEHGSTSEKPFTITIKGTNDVPVLTPSEKEVTLELKESGVKQGGNEAEGGVAAASGKLTVSDADKDDKLTYVVKDAEGNEITGTLQPDGHMTFNVEYGILHIYPDGSYTYQLLNSNQDVNTLPYGESLNEHFSVQVKDQNGALSENSQDINVKIEGTNDRPTFTLNNTGADAKHSFTDGVHTNRGGTIQIGDVDEGHINTISITGKGGTTGTAVDGKNMAGTDHDAKASFTTECGKLTIDPATGKYDYTLDPDSEFVRALSAGEKHTEKFTIRVQDEHGAWVEKEIEIVITGKNDAPDVTASHLDIQEDTGKEGVVMEGTLAKSGKVDANDVDGDKMRYNLVDDDGTLRQTLKGEGGVDQDGNLVTGEYGYLTLNATTGEYEYKLFNDSELVQKMGEGDSVTQTFIVRVSDGKGGFTNQEITVTIKGTNDLPTLTGNHAGVVEDGGALARPDLPGEEATNPTTSGKLVIHDIDTNDEKSFLLKGDGVNTAENGDMSIAGKYGILTLHPDGSYTYELTYKGTDLQEMNPDELFAQEKFDVIWKSGKDENTTTITIDINGSNDRPDQGNQESNTDKAPCTDSGIVPGFDIDSDDSIADGSLSFSIMNQYGPDGKPVQGGAFEDTTGKEDAPGANDNHWQPEQTGDGLYGSLTINPDGTYTYTLNIFDKDALDAYFKANPDADSINETFTVTVTDEHGASHSQEITVSVPKGDIPGMGNGEGGKPNPDTFVENITTKPLEVQEDGTLNQSGKVEIDLSCKHGPDHPGDGEGHDKGHGDDKFFLFAFQDADGNYVQTISDQYGSITINPITGEYTYTLNNASKYVQEMNEGETWKPELPPVYVVTGPDADGNWIPGIDANGKPVKGDIDITITGENDAPIIDGAKDLTVGEDATGKGATVSGKVEAHDVDSGGLTGESLTYSFTDATGQAIGADGIETPYGKLTVNADGSYSFTVDPTKTQSLGQGQEGHVKFTVTVQDENGASVTKEIDVTITGNNDAPVWTVDGKDLTFTEDGGIGVLTGKVEAMDVDKGDTAVLRYSMTNEDGQSSSHILPSAYGTMILNPKTGEYEFRLDGDSKQVQELGAGESRTQTYTITVSDGKGGTTTQDVTVTIKGTDDAAVITMGKASIDVKEAAQGQENAEVSFGKIAITDKDANDTQTLTIKSSTGEDTVKYKSGDEAAQVEGKYGILTMNADGTYSYKLTSDALGAGEKYNETFTIYVKEYAADGTVLKTTEQKITVKLEGTNDTPVVDTEHSVLHRDLAEVPGGTTSTSGKLVATDVDGDKLSFSSSNGEYGTVTIDANGNYTYTLKPDVNFPDAALGHDKFTITIKDGKGGEVKQDITIDLTGSNDIPVVNNDKSDLHQDLVETDDGFPVLDGKLDVTDADKDVLHYSVADDHAPQFGSVTIDADGTYHYTLNEGYTPEQGAEDTFTVTIDDGHGGVIEQEVTIGITPQPETEPTPGSTPEPESVENLGLFLPEGDEDLFLGSPLEHTNPLAQGVDHYGTENESAADMLAADLFPRGQEENLDSLLDTLSQGNNAIASPDLPAVEAPVEVPAETIDVAASLPQVDAMAEATALAAHKIVLENNG